MPSPALSERREALSFLEELWLTDREAYECLAHIANEAASNAITGKRLKDEGVKSGYPDYLIDIAVPPWNGFRLELKARNGRIADNQIEWSDRHLKRGYASVFGWGASDCMHYWQAYRAGLLTHDMCLDSRNKPKNVRSKITSTRNKPKVVQSTRGARKPAQLRLRSRTR